MTSEPIGDRRRREWLPGGGFAYVLVDEGVRVEARHLHRDHHRLYAEVDVRADWAGVKNPLSSARQEVTSQTARTALANYCHKRSHTKPEDNLDWHDVIDCAFIDFTAADREGDAVIVLDDAPSVALRDYTIDGLTVPADAASFLIAPGDSLKSLITLYVLGTLARRGHHVLYLDWEWTADRHKQRKQRLFGAERLPSLHYLRCRAPLTVETDRIRRICDRDRIEFLAIDSVGMACDGKLVDDDTARRFHQARELLPPALCAAHVAKSALDADVKTDPHAFGSVYFENLCRMAWAVKKQPSATGDDEVTVGLFRTKQNDGARAAAVGWTFTFAPERIDVRATDLATVDGLAERLPLATRMIHALRSGAKTYAALATELDAKVDSVIQAARRSSAFTKITNTPDGIHRLALVERRREA